MTATFEAKVPDRTLGPLLASMAGLSAKAEHALDVDRHVRGRPLHECKGEYLVRFGLTVRQFDAVEVNLRGKVNATEEAQKPHIDQLKGAIAAAKKA